MVKRRTPLATILAQIPAARAREARERRAGRRALSAYYDRRTARVIMELSNGCMFGFPVGDIPALSTVTMSELVAVEVTPGGSGLYWEALDVDLSVPGLLLAAVARDEKLSELARIAGSTKSPAKAAAARRNGAKGGRPKTRRVSNSAKSRST